MGEIGVSELGKTLNSNKDTGELTPYLCSINIHWKYINLEEVKKTRFTKEEQKKYILSKNDLLVCEGGDIGRCFVWNFPIPMYYQNALHRIRFYNEINPFFLKFAIEHYKNIHILDKYSKGVTIKHLTKIALHSICFPLPPLAEQHRIVEKIEELLALVDDLETNKTDLQSYIKQTKSKVLEMAIRGELVPQNPEDEPASVLLERIKKEQKSSKSKGKTTEHNTHYEEELPFDIPKNWVWCRVGEVCDIYQPKTITTKEITKSGKYKVFGANGVIGYYNKYNHDFEEVAVTCRGATCGTVNMTEAKSWITGNAMVITPLNSYLSKKYLFYYLKNSNMEDIITGSAQPQITKTKIEKLLFIIPPLAEQHRIVVKIEEIFSALEFIEENLI